MRDDEFIELADDDLEEPTSIDEFDPAKATTPAIGNPICEMCNGPAIIAGPTDFSGEPLALIPCARSPNGRWGVCATKQRAWKDF